jgi:CRP/FNR family transcriptional regulator
MFNEASKFSDVFEADLLAELETKSIVMKVNGGETMINPGQTIRAVSLVISGLGSEVYAD